MERELKNIWSVGRKNAPFTLSEGASLTNVGGHKQPPVVKQAGEVGLFSLPRRLSAIDNPAAERCHGDMVGDPCKQEAHRSWRGETGLLNHKWLTEEPGWKLRLRG